MTSAHPRGPRPLLTATVLVASTVVSLGGLTSAALLNHLVRDGVAVRDGQWWRVVTAVLVQPSGWGQAAFNLLGLALVGTQVERLAGRVPWAIAYAVGAVGSSALQTWWHPSGSGGGSSDGVGALVGLLVVMLATRATPRSAVGPARSFTMVSTCAIAYACFWVGYLTAIPVVGPVAAIVTGHVAVIGYAVVHESARRGGVGTTRLVSVVALGLTAIAAVLLTVLGEGHGTGLLTGLVVGAVAVAAGGPAEDHTRAAAGSGPDRRELGAG